MHILCFIVLVNLICDVDAAHVHRDMWVTARCVSMRMNASWRDLVTPEYGA